MLQKFIRIRYDRNLPHFIRTFIEQINIEILLLTEL